MRESDHRRTSSKSGSIPFRQWQKTFEASKALVAADADSVRGAYPIMLSSLALW